MNSEYKFWDDQDLLASPTSTEPISESVQELIDLFRLLKIDDKISAKRLIKKEQIFN